MSQQTFAEAEFENKRHTTRREIFPQRLEALIPWESLRRRIRHLRRITGSDETRVLSITLERGH